MFISDEYLERSIKETGIVQILTNCDASDKSSARQPAPSSRAVHQTEQSVCK